MSSSSSIKKLIRGFYRRVHPDLMQGCPSVAVESNTRSLKDLNAYIDRLESSETITAPFSRRTINFFSKITNRRGAVIEGPLKPFPVVLESIPPSADILDKEEISVRLVRAIEKGMDPTGLFSSKSPEGERIEPIISQKMGTGARGELNKIWNEEALRDQIRSHLFESMDQRMERAKNYQSIIIYNKLVKKYSKLKNTKRRLKRWEGIAHEVQAALKEKSVPSMIDQILTNDSDDDTKVKVIESGFHPDLVFFDPELSDSEREEGIARICGINLHIESDQWLLENIWKVVRIERRPGVPVVLSRNFEADLKGGFIFIPFDFELNPLVEFFEDNLESVRVARKGLIESFVPI